MNIKKNLWWIIPVGYLASCFVVGGFATGYICASKPVKADRTACGDAFWKASLIWPVTVIYLGSVYLGKVASNV